MSRRRNELTSRSPRNPSRSDSRATQARLIEATGRLLGKYRGLNFSMADLAAEADVSQATVYRYFHSIEEAIETYISGFVDDVVAERAALAETEVTGIDAIYSIGAAYVRVADRWGDGLIHVRSPIGFLARRRAGDPIIVTVADLASDAIRSGMEELGLDESDLDFALLLWNGIFDPREINELRKVQGWSVEDVGERLTTAFIGAITASPDSYRTTVGAEPARRRSES